MTLFLLEFRAKQLKDGNWAKGTKKKDSNNKNSVISGLTKVSWGRLSWAAVTINQKQKEGRGLYGEHHPYIDCTS